jgi:hypothetical protein
MRRLSIRREWLIPSGTALICGLLILIMESSIWFDLGEIGFYFILAPFVAIILGLLANARRTLPSLLTPVIFCAIILVAFQNREAIRDQSRWLLRSNRYKADLQSQAAKDGIRLTHEEWVSTGFAGVANNTVYLVYDPGDSLFAAAKTGGPGRFSGLPCDVYRVRRLERGWYAIHFYTDTDWNDCGTTSIPTASR